MKTAENNKLIAEGKPKMSNKRTWRVRFHLAKGPYFMKWQLKTGSEKVYCEPEEVNISMRKCKLVNQPSTAQKIYDGANKTVCAWIETEDIKILDKKTLEVSIFDLEEIYYNPRKAPQWTNDKGENLDGVVFMSLVTLGRKIYVNKNYNNAS